MQRCNNQNEIARDLSAAEGSNKEGTVMMRNWVYTAVSQKIMKINGAICAKWNHWDQTEGTVSTIVAVGWIAAPS